jgi:hypothetical protein
MLFSEQVNHNSAVKRAAVFMQIVLVTLLGGTSLVVKN